MKNDPFFEWITRNIIMDEKDYEKYFNDLLNDLQ